MLKIAIVARNENVSSDKDKTIMNYCLPTKYIKAMPKGIGFITVCADEQLGDNMEEYLEYIANEADGLVLTGSCIDVPPRYYGEEGINGWTYPLDEFQFDKKLIELFEEQGKPILGVCAGSQDINVAHGGTLHQDIENHCKKPDGYTHEISIKEGTFLYEVYGEKAQVNTYHHQASKDPAPGFVVSAVSEDGIIEAIEKGNIIGVQWHPEKQMDKHFFEVFFKKFFNYEA
ncbi:MAG: gamma-glutamyl-gamma-aminobutyrate hydrolase family protein [Clostridia bacterium]|nr:gamma-glutamyl-gamma-aminobutyrate hydrolase family protein [Clostridia bacterium]